VPAIGRRDVTVPTNRYAPGVVASSSRCAASVNPSTSSTRLQSSIARPSRCSAAHWSSVNGGLGPHVKGRRRRRLCHSLSALKRRQGGRLFGNDAAEEREELRVGGIRLGVQLHRRELPLLAGGGLVEGLRECQRLGLFFLKGLCSNQHTHTHSGARRHVNLHPPLSHRKAHCCCLAAQG
jgi:hypothetical protein